MSSLIRNHMNFTFQTRQAMLLAFNRNLVMVYELRFPLSRWSRLILSSDGDNK
jgi:hypothetical protein